MRKAEERSFITHDGTELFYRYWPAAESQADKPPRAIVLFHRGHEHGGRMQHVVDELALPQYAMFAWDARGHGRSPGARGYSPSFGASVKDVDCFIKHVEAQHGIATEHIAVIAQSVGAVLVATWVHDYAPKIACQVLASPAFKVKLYVPFARTGLALMQKLRGNFFVNSYVKAKFLTHDPERIRSYETDPLITRPISVNILLALYRAAERIVADAQAITLPTQLLISGADFVVHKKPQQQFFDRLGAAVKEQQVLPGFYHDTLGERDRAPAIAHARRFIEQAFAQAPARVSLLDADRRGHTFNEYEALRRPLPALSLKRMQFAATRAGLRLGGALSEGIKLGFATGFDSGSTLDYVYRNEAQGVPLLGTLVDRIYLDSPGWAGIRVRKQHVERLLARAMTALRDAGAPVRVVDIAAGHGRYVLDALTASGVRADAILLRDYSDINVRDGSALIRSRGLQDRARFEMGDAFDGEQLAQLNPAPTVAVVSGLYELFPSNDLIRASLGGLARAIASGGYLVYTGQPWHPQLELIARALTSHRQGEPWVMRRRTQAEMDQLVEAAGFRKLDQLIDEEGIFTVSLAQRVA